MPQAAAQAKAPAAAPAQPAVKAAAKPGPAAPLPPRFTVLLDAAHGGSDMGAKLSPHLLEKDFVLALSLRLRSMLSAHGVAVLTERDTDTAIPAINRANMANHLTPSACISLHATTSGSGIHLFTSSLSPIPLTRFLPWDTAQGAYIDQSLHLSSDIDSAMTGADVPVTLGRTALQPLDNFTCPAVAVELAPLIRSGKVTPISDAEYQTRIVTALAAAIEHWQRDWSPQS
jgi:N-acetylmuramoyl-L-alanine amidase